MTILAKRKRVIYKLQVNVSSIEYQEIYRKATMLNAHSISDYLRYKLGLDSKIIAPDSK